MEERKVFPGFIPLGTVASTYKWEDLGRAEAAKSSGMGVRMSTETSTDPLVVCRKEQLGHWKARDPGQHLGHFLHRSRDTGLGSQVPSILWGRE